MFDWRLELALWLMLTWLLSAVLPWPMFLVLAGFLIISYALHHMAGRP